MSEIKVDSAVKEQIQKLLMAGARMSSKCVRIDSGSKLPTCNEYRTCIEEINQVMRMFRGIVFDDAQQIKQFCSDMEKQDNA